MACRVAASRETEGTAQALTAIEKSGLSLVDTRTMRCASGWPPLVTPRPTPRGLHIDSAVLLIGLPLLMLVMFWWTGSSPGIVRLYLTLVVAAALGLYVPRCSFEPGDRRQRQIIQRLSGRAST